VSEDLYFAYGSNLDADQMRERCPGSRALGRAALPDHRIDFTYYSTRWNGGAADVLPHSGERVWGVLYALGADDLSLLDRFERGYDRVFLRVTDGSGQALTAVSYAVREKRTFRPNEIYLEKMLRWAARWELPDAYQELLRSFPVHRARGPQRLPRSG